VTETVLFDASRLLSRADRGAPTGVDRVCLAYAEWLLSTPGLRMVPVRARRDRLAAVDEGWFRRHVAELRERWTGDAEAPLTEQQSQLFDALWGNAPVERSVLSPPPEVQPPPHPRLRVWRQYFRSRPMPTRLPAAKLYFNVGHTSLNTPDILADLRARGVTPVLMIHDLIPITHPEFCRPGDGERHRRRVRIALGGAGRIIVNSRYTADELLAFAGREGLTPPPVDVAHLGLEPVFLNPRSRDAGHPYFVHVGTIEARKNLAFLLTLWRRLQERMGARAPRLALIGRYGWENEAVLDHLERSPNLQGLVHQAADLPDAALAELMRRARAVLSPSSVEGFDLPAVEASALGAPLIASDIPAHRELAAHAKLIDPLDGLGWMEAIERATLERPPPPPPYAAPTWAGHFARVAAAVGPQPPPPVD
jgi:glycosyltransferase involved in cell wall biosynthesis